MGVYGNQAPRRRGALASSLRGKGPGPPTPAPCWALVLVARSSPTLNWLESAPLAARKEDPRNVEGLLRVCQQRSGFGDIDFGQPCSKCDTITMLVACSRPPACAWARLDSS